MFERWCDAMRGLGMIVVILVIVLVVVFVVKEKRVDGYYVSHPNTGDTATCVYAHWTWHLDEKAYCSSNLQEVFDFAEHANKLVK